MRPPLPSGTLLIGATFYAAAYAACAREACLIVEPKSVVGSDFADCMNAAPCPAMEYTPVVAELRAELVERGLLGAGGRIHIVPCSAVLGAFLLRQRIPTLLETQIISLMRHGAGVAVRLFNRDGFQTHVVRQVIDTRGCLVGRAHHSLGLMLVNGKGEPPAAPEDPYWIQQGLFPDEYILHLRLAPEDTTLSARLKLFRLIDGGAPARGGWQAAAAASTFAYHYPAGPVRQENARGVWRIPSASFGNLLAALEGGAHDAISHAG